MTDISELKGKIVDHIMSSSDEIQFHMSDGDIYYMWHEQDCCEDVTVEEIIGDLNDLTNSPILEAEKTSNEEKTDWDGDKEWTFYKFGTIKGHVTIRWYGESNGYYATDVSFRKNTKAWCS